MNIDKEEMISKVAVTEVVTDDSRDLAEVLPILVTDATAGTVSFQNDASGIVTVGTQPIRVDDLPNFQISRVLNVESGHFTIQEVIPVDNSVDLMKRRFLFHTRVQQVRESLQEFANSLKNLGQNCNFDVGESFIDNLIRDRFMAGIRSKLVQQELLKLGDLNLESMLSIATSLQLQDGEGNLAEEFRPKWPILDTVKPTVKRKEHLCQVCDKKFTNKKFLVKHLRDDHGQSETFHCGCGQAFKDKIKLNKHKLVHSGGGNICKFCDQSFKNEWSLKSHVRLKHEAEGGKVCLICFEMFDDEITLKYHQEQIHSDLGQQCKVCNKQLRQDESLKRHMARKHNDENKSMCPHCGKMFVLLDQHIAKDHSGPVEAVSKCEECDFKGSSKALLYHRNYHHKKGPGFSCSICDYKTPHKNVLKQHVKLVHEKLKPYTCSQCPRSFFAENRLKDHVLVVHQNKWFECSACSKSYKVRRQLQLHIRSVHEGIWVHCPKCKLKFAENHDLKRHLKHVHDKNYSFPCPHCGRGFTFQARLKYHISKHH